MTDREKKSVRLEITPERHQKWTEFVSESDNYSTLSGLLRSAVAREIQIAQSDRPHGTTEADVDLSPITEALCEIE